MTRTYAVAVTQAPNLYIKSSNIRANDNFGNSIAATSDTLVIGARFEDSNATGIGGNQADNSAVDSGAVYVFVRTGTTWTQQAYIKASNTGTGDLFGFRRLAVRGHSGRRRWRRGQQRDRHQREWGRQQRW